MRPPLWRRLAVSLSFLAALPAAEYTTYIGDATPYRVARIIADSAGNTYIAGSRVFNTGHGPLSPNPLADAFVMKLDPTGKTVAFAYLSGKGNDAANDVAVDAAGNLYMAGSTSSPNFPLHNPLQSTPGSGFIAKFSPDGANLLYSTYFPGAVAALAVDPAGNMYVTGSTNSPAFPTTAGLPAGGVTAGVPMVFGAFLTKISAAGDRILYSTVLAGSDKNCGCCSSCFTSIRAAGGVAIALDPAGNAYIAGNTDTLNLPTTPGAMLATGPGAFLAKVNAAGSALSYLTYIGPGNLVVSPFSNPANTARALAVDSSGNAYLAGYTFDPKFPATPGAFQTVFNGPSDIGFPQPTPPGDAFALKLNPAGTAAVWATYIGGKASDTANSVALDSSGNVWIAGNTQSTDFPNQQGWSEGPDFVLALNPSGSALVYSGRYPAGTAAQSVAVDSTGLLHVAGAGGLVSVVAAAPRPAMRPFGIANAAYGSLGGQIAPGEVVSIYGPHIGPVPPVYASGGVQVLFDDIPAPLLYASDSQINAVVPFGIANRTSARVRIVFNGVSSPDFRAAVIPDEPEIFQIANHSAAAVNQDGTVNSADHPAPAGSIVSIWATGVPPPAEPVDGRIATAADDYHCCQMYSDSTPLRVLYGGAAPGMMAGIVQVNFQLPAVVNAPSYVYVSLVTWDRASNPVLIYVAP